MSRLTATAIAASAVAVTACAGYRSTRPVDAGTPDVSGDAPHRSGTSDSGAPSDDSPDSDAAPKEVVPFKDGVYLLHAPIKEPVPTQLTMYVDLLALDDGTISMTAGRAAAVDGAAKNTKDLSELVVDTTDGGFCIHTGGVITVDDDGERFLSTNTFDVNLNLLGILLTLKDVKFTGAVQADGDQDSIEGTINYSSIEGLGDHVFAAGNSAFTMTWIPSGAVPSSAPRNCGSLVGGVKNECNPPADFPPAAFCAEDEPVAE